MNTGFVRPAVATVLTVYGIETPSSSKSRMIGFAPVATVLTVYGIETWQQKEFIVMIFCHGCNSTYRLRY